MAALPLVLPSLTRLQEGGVKGHVRLRTEVFRCVLYAGELNVLGKTRHEYDHMKKQNKRRFFRIILWCLSVSSSFEVYLFM